MHYLDFSHRIFTKSIWRSWFWPAVDLELWEDDHMDGHSVHLLISSNVGNISETKFGIERKEIGQELEVSGICWPKFCSLAAWLWGRLLRRTQESVRKSACSQVLRGQNQDNTGDASCSWINSRGELISWFPRCSWIRKLHVSEHSVSLPLLGC